MPLDSSIPGHLANVQLLARACQFAYLPEAEGAAAFQAELGMTARLISVDNTQAYLATDEQSVVVAFRGSQAPTSLDGFKDWLLTNANNLLVALAYGQSKLYSGAVNATKAKEAALTVGYTMGALTPKFTYAHVWDTKTSGVKADDGINQYVIGVDYALSKRTTAYTSFGYVKHDNVIVAGTDERKERTLAVGLRHKF